MSPEQKVKIRRLATLTILHPEYSNALDTIHRAIESAGVIGDSSGAILLGDSGTGKSRICSQLISEYPAASFMRVNGDEQLIMPVAYCRVPNDATVKSLMTRMLREFGAYRPWQNQEALEACLFSKLDKCQTQLLILDEWPHLYRTETAKAIKLAADFAKVLSDSFQRAILLVGEFNIEGSLDTHSALADRFPYRAYLHPFSLKTQDDWNIFRKILRVYANYFTSEMGFSVAPPMTDEKMILAFYAATGGNFRGLFSIIKESLLNALSRNDQTFLTEDLIIGWRRIKIAARLTGKNSFEMPASELKKIIAETSKKRKKG
ncbi:TniB family NTP-binding protein [Pseudomonas frederiksbergensis]|uniref:AAA+ ATPase domain-containing protein n=1 Tax=Pseudomonas frederiksbergensis TaxID=104087 RepID=A0A423HW83_9PSED|nr:TniB family NTP-binding protein [Pseudomonas frederiksbergensis]RON17491.1 hypothetical protein BK662_07135 [Pseudomonas frederiksbergensis]